MRLGDLGSSGFGGNTMACIVQIRVSVAGRQSFVGAGC